MFCLFWGGTKDGTQGLMKLGKCSTTQLPSQLPNTLTKTRGQSPKVGGEPPRNVLQRSERNKRIAHD